MIFSVELVIILCYHSELHSTGFFFKENNPEGSLATCHALTILHEALRLVPQFVTSVGAVCRGLQLVFPVVLHSLSKL